MSSQLKVMTEKPLVMRVFLLTRKCSHAVMKRLGASLGEANASFGRCCQSRQFIFCVVLMACIYVLEGGIMLSINVFI